MKKELLPGDKLSIYIAKRIDELSPYEADREVYESIKILEEISKVHKRFHKEPNLTIEDALKDL